MKFICLGYMEEKKWDAMSESEQNAFVRECFAYDDVLREAIVRGGRRHDWDPWWVYPWGQSDEAEGRLEALRQQAVK